MIEFYLSIYLFFFISCFSVLKIFITNKVCAFWLSVYLVEIFLKKKFILTEKVIFYLFKKYSISELYPSGLCIDYYLIKNIIFIFRFI